MTAKPESEAIARHFRNGLPALVVGGFALLLLVYGYLIQPSRLAGWYQSNENNVQTAFLHEIAADNPNRTVQSVLQSARRGRIVHERLLQMGNNAPSETLASSLYMVEVAKGLQRWISEDQGFIDNAQRDTIIQLCNEYLEQSRTNLMGVLGSNAKEKPASVQLLAKELLLRGALNEEQLELLRNALIEASDADPNNSELATYAAELEIDRLASRSPFKSNELLNQMAERVSHNLSLRGVVVLATKNLNENPKQIVRLIEKSLADESLRDSAHSIDDRIALIKAYAIVADWKNVETLLPSLLKSCILPSYRQYVGTCLAAHFELLMASQLPVAVPVWCERADLCQNLVIQLNPGDRASADRLFDATSGTIKNSPDCLSQSLLSTSLLPLKGVITLLAASEEDSASSGSGREWELAANVVSQICLAKANSDQSTLARGVKILTPLAEKYSENGNVWYSLAILQFKSGERQKALQSAQRAQKLLGDLPSILYLIKELDVQ